MLGCEAVKEYTYNHVAYIIGNTQNVPVFPFSEESNNFPKILKYTSNSAYKNQNATIAAFSVADGLEIKNGNGASSIQSDDKSDDEGIERAKQKLSEVKGAFASAPTQNGADYYKTISNAIEALKYARNSDDEKLAVVIYGSGLSDSGVLNFTNTSSNLLARDADEVTVALEKAGGIVQKEVKNLSITWYGLGATVYPQADLSAKEKQNLENIYRGIIKYTFGIEPQFKSAPASGASVPTSGKTVKTAPVLSSKLVFHSYVDSTTSVLSFKASEIAFKNEVEASKELDNLAKEINNSASQLNSVEILAYAADPHTGELQTITQNRANRVRQELINRGVTVAIEAIGKGHGGLDEWVNGSFNEEIAAQNRIVTIKGIN